MRLLYPVALACLLAAPAHAQETPADTTRYQLAADERRVASFIDSTGNCTELLRFGPHRALLRTFYPSGGLHEYQPYASLPRRLRHGISSAWAENGQLLALEPYESGLRTGTMLRYYEDGRLKRRTEFVAGAERPGPCYDPTGQPVAYFPYEEPPLYPGGNEQLAKEINQVLRRARRPVASFVWVNNYLQISFLITEGGQIHTPRITVSSQQAYLDTAALAAVRQLSYPWRPGRRDGQLAPYTYQLRINLADEPTPGLLPRRRSRAGR
ncbi:MAG: hypothetical protein EOO59_09970 [Hymenobacter sp.]|nr:MAG: hypothetical protein EOO59_09970 [Hymenobacter sp.]